MRWSTLLERPSAPLPERDWWSLACPPEPGQPYGRALLHAGPAGEVMLMQWRPGLWTAPHDHGGAGGLVRVLQGSLRERRYAMEGGELVLLRERVAQPGQSLGIGASQIHAVKASVASLSLHVYWPMASRGMWVHDVLLRRAHLVPPGHGAWLPKAPTPVRDWSTS